MPLGEVFGKRSNGHILQWTRKQEHSKQVLRHTRAHKDLLLTNLDVFFEQTLKIMETNFIAFVSKTRLGIPS